MVKTWCGRETNIFWDYLDSYICWIYPDYNLLVVALVVKLRWKIQFWAYFALPPLVKCGGWGTNVFWDYFESYICWIYPDCHLLVVVVVKLCWKILFWAYFIMYWIWGRALAPTIKRGNGRQYILRLPWMFYEHHTSILQSISCGGSKTKTSHSYPVACHNKLTAFSPFFIVFDS
jgi:hypothetical protein